MEFIDKSKGKMYLLLVWTLVLVSGVHGFSFYGSDVRVMLCLRSDSHKNNFIRRGSKRIYSVFNQESESEALFTEEEIQQLNDYFKDLKDGVYGHEMKKQFEDLEKSEANRHLTQETDDIDPKAKIKELMNEENKELDERLSKIFNIANLPVSNEELSWDDMEEIAKKEQKGIQIEEVQSLVKSIYRKKGLLTEPLKICKFDGLTLKWTQNLKSIDIWFSVDPSLTKDDFGVNILPSKITILRQGEIILQKELNGKIDCDGSFWTMHNNPSSTLNYINISLAKRKPKYANIWEDLFVKSKS
ncbi:signal peptide-containing protein [Theileria equi strain WA]|uniref:Signal peptide-containing protein n=1 Tax=Theileria equi strain WA TaxID=1537102 RepID=L0B0D2_THEEQ|nr:signal peptide-containing protein [Theileria equi strain WA]AFZ80594.1 signal peptide-containing protein [Theileria equi strain WA]|eukprot:XP_004830260.1 signal peptide-containing protein [Theileria equi strain WA]